jgi:hypothetical protein
MPWSCPTRSYTVRIQAFSPPQPVFRCTVTETETDIVTDIVTETVTNNTETETYIVTETDTDTETDTETDIVTEIVTETVTDIVTESDTAAFVKSNPATALTLLVPSADCLVALRPCAPTTRS